MSEDFMFDSDVNWNIRFFRMKEGFTFGKQVKERDIENHKKLNNFGKDDYLIVLDDDNNILYSDLTNAST